MITKIRVTAINLKKDEYKESHILNHDSLNIFNDLQKKFGNKALHYINHKDSPLIAYEINKGFTLALKANKDSTSVYLNDVQTFGKISELNIFTSNKIKFYKKGDKCHSAIPRIKGLTNIEKLLLISNVTFAQYKQLMNYTTLDRLEESEADNNDSIKLGLTPDSLIERLERQSEIGADGELFAVTWEINRLMHEENATREDAQLAVKHVALENTNLGYDIVSAYKGKKRFIEVKTTNISKNTDFFFTINEFNVLKKLNANAYIYRITLETEKVEVIRNPFESKETNDFIAIAFKANLDSFSK